MPDQVTANVEEQVGVNVTVSPSPEFLTRIDERVTSAVGNIVVIGSGGPGSTGRSMPEAGAPSNGSACP